MPTKRGRNHESQNDIIVAGHLPDKMQAAAHATSQPKVRSNLLTLPQEIQDMIFDFAYPTTENFKVISSESWRENEQESTLFRWESGLDSRDHFIFTSHHDLMTEFAKTAILESYDFRLSGKSLPNLQHLTILISDVEFGILEPKLAWEDDLDDEDLQGVVQRYKYDNLSGLRELHFKPEECSYAVTPIKALKWVENVKKLENFLRPIVTRPKQQSHTPLRSKEADCAVPLYHGSSVALDSSRLIVKTTETRHRKRTRLNSQDGLETTSASASLWSTRTPLAAKPLRLQDLPDDVSAFKLILENNSDGVMDCIKELKRINSARSW